MSAELTALHERCERALDRALPDATAGRLAAAMRHAVLGGGKRLRPLLVQATGRALGVPERQLDPAMVAIELIHAYSLVHDDLPAMDDDDLRRGQPTVHVAFDQATAILAGDALQALAYEVLTTGVEAGVPATRVLAQIRELATAAGTDGMVGGQAQDLALVGRSTDLDTLSRMHGLKTGALIRASVRLAALAGGTLPTAQRARLDRYAEALGLAFQIQDDVLDETGDSAVTGKAVGADRERGKPTYVALLGVEAATAEAKSQHALALAALAGMQGDTTLLQDLTSGLLDRHR